MPDAVYPEGLENFAKGNIDLDVDTLRAWLIDTNDYTYASTHSSMSDVPAAARVANVDLTSVTCANGVIDAADSTFSSVTGDVSEAIIIAKVGANDAASYLLCYIDSYSGLPVTPNGGNIPVTWPTAGIFSL